jgi:hypothetical protein
MMVSGFTIACDSPDCPPLFVLASEERLTVEAFAVVIRERVETAEWTRDRHGNVLCPGCSLPACSNVPRWLASPNRQRSIGGTADVLVDENGPIAATRSRNHGKMA